MSNDGKDSQVAAAINVEDFRLVKLSIQSMEPQPDKANWAVYVGVLTPQGWIWYDPTLNGLELAGLPEEAVKDLDMAVQQWDKHKAEGTLTHLPAEAQGAMQ